MVNKLVSNARQFSYLVDGGAGKMAMKCFTFGVFQLRNTGGQPAGKRHWHRHTHQAGRLLQHCLWQRDGKRDSLHLPLFNIGVISHGHPTATVSRSCLCAQ